MKHTTLFIACLLLASCGGSPEPPASSASPQSSALDQMEVAFAASPTRASIKAALDAALPMYGHPVTEENYSRAGSTLVSLRKSNPDFSEMAILACMTKAHYPNVDFPNAAALAVVDLKTSGCR
jgi:hypothetical protein